MKQNVLNEPTRKVLKSIDLAADITVPEIAKQTHLSTPNVQRIIKKLIDQSVLIGITAQIDFTRLGLTEYGINLALATPSANAREKFVKSLIKEQSVGWLAEVGADYDYMFNIVATMPHQVEKLLSRLSSNLDGSILHKELCIRTKRARFERGIFGASGKRPVYFQIGNNPDHQAIDKLDRDILRLLSTSNRLSFRKLADQLSISSSTFSRRLQILKEKKIILGFSWHMDLSRIGILQYRILISVRSSLPVIRSKILQMVHNTPAIKMFADCIGAWDYEMELDVFSAQEVRPLIAQLSEVCFGHLEKITVIPLFQHRKFSTFPI